MAKKKTARRPVARRPDGEASPAGRPETGAAETVVFIHGISNKPPASVLKCQWDTALFGLEVGERSRMAYWVNREYYPDPLSDTCAAGDLTDLSEPNMVAVGLHSTKEYQARAAGVGRDLVEVEIEALSQNTQEADFLRAVAEDIAQDQERAWTEFPAEGAAAEAGEVRAKVLPLPPFMRRWVTGQITRAFLRDVHDFFFDDEKRAWMEDSLRERLEPGGGPFVIVAHSQGTMIAYNVLRQMSPSDCDVRLFVTLGSPLGIAEVQDFFRQWTGSRTLPVPACVGRWVNVADRLDPVAARPHLASRFSGPPAIVDHVGFGINLESPRHPHSGTGYLRIAAVRSEVRSVLREDFSQAVGRSYIARDLVEDLENDRAEQRHPVLIQLKESDEERRSPDVRRTLDQLRREVVESIRSMVGSREGAELEELKRFLAARLTRREIESLRSRFGGLNIERIWRDAEKKALLWQSTHTVQARPASQGYGATGRGICWAVLDTGIAADHPHFSRHKNIVAQWDCTRPGLEPQPKAPDRNGHGTHVAGIIAGCCAEPLPWRPGELPVDFTAMAPEAGLHVYKVLSDNGNGRDSWIIKALDHIADVNESAVDLVIHGVNLSLGGAFDPKVFGCGHSPLCQELRRLWRQGVVVCLAAGNEGHAFLKTDFGQIPANLGLSIGDPANLDEAIAVGSVHKTNPFTYGISYFSSRGPTADGRRKPDLVAPGERIRSASYRFQARPAVVDDLYVEMSGTSMATPHVSGILAAFLSLRREFIGYPEQVKQILLASCTDLGRDPYSQGRGVPNLVKMLVST